jgi:chitin synthase
VSTCAQIFIDSTYLELEPIGLVFLLSFALLLFIQFFAMLFHRFGTLSHILSSTEMEWYCTKKVRIDKVRIRGLVNCW